MTVLQIRPYGPVRNGPKARGSGGPPVRVGRHRRPGLGAMWAAGATTPGACRTVSSLSSPAPAAAARVRRIPGATRRSVHPCSIISHKTYYDDYSYYNCFSLIIAIIAIILIISFRLAGICGLSSTIRARLQETCSLCHPHSKHSGKTCSCACWRHRNHSVPPAQRLSGRTRRPPAGCRRRMRDVVCQLVGIGMVP